ncbi:hypothetical protein, partial [Saccharospirillum sp. MSK14-1]|uniref:hypothetical protein n=1 Tax=Saccharospirillum sp. MSK14-1 TaxID=1897632 RepID=UPI0018EE6FF0
TIDYTNGKIEISDYTGRPPTALIIPISVLIGEEFNILNGVTFRTVNSPLRPSGFTIRAKGIDGTDYTAAESGDGDMTGNAVTGGDNNVHLSDGLVSIKFAVPMLASSLFYNAVSFKSIPLQSSILGLDPVRLPADGRVPIFRDADILVLTHTQKDEIISPVDAMVIDAGREKLHDAWIEDSAGTRLKADQVTIDKATGTATLASPFSAVDDSDNALTGPLFFVHRIDDMALCSEARIDGQLTLAQPVAHDYPADSWVASAVYLGHLQARIKNLVSYTTDIGYGNTGIDTDAQYNDIAYPIAIDNSGSVPDRWMIKFTSTTNFSLYSEERGLVASGTTVVDFSPVNPQTGTPYFTFKADGWGAGWNPGNCVFFDSDAAAAPLWLIRTILPGQATETDDQLKIELRGDHN